MFTGQDTLVYRVCDDGTPLPAQCDTALVVITVGPVNDPPVAVDDPVTTPEDTPVTVCVLTNDTDTEGLLSGSDVMVLDGPTNGTAVLNPLTGCVTYTPDPDFNGQDTIEYKVCDSGTPVLCDTALVIITVTPENDPPVAADDHYTTPEDTPVSGEVDLNDSDVEGLDPNGVTLVNGPANGTLVLNPNGTFTYTPDADYNGSDAFTYSVCDLGLPVLCDTATVTIDILPVNDKPVAVDDSATTPEDTPVTFSLSANDSDVDGNLDPTTVGLLSTPPATQGTVLNNGDGTITFVPAPNFNGTVTPFEYRICDTGGLCDTATVYINVTPVNDPPVAVNDGYNTPQNTPVIGEVDLNDTDPDSNLNPNGVTLVSGPSDGTLTLNPDGSFTYTPDNGFSGTDQFVYSICDLGTPVYCDTAIASIVVDQVVNAPVAVNDNATTPEDTPVTFSLSSNDSDLDGNLDPTTVTLLNVPPITQGTVVNNGDGTITFIPAPNYSGPVTPFDYRICDLSGLCDTATITIGVTPVNDPPVAVNDGYTIPEDTPLSGQVDLNDSDPDGNLNPNGVTLVSGPANGSLILNPDGTFLYIPDTGFNGTDQFTYQICDLGLPVLCDMATVTIIITPVNDPPVALDDTAITAENSPVTVDVLANDTDSDGNLNPSSVTIINQPDHGTATVNPVTGEITYTPDNGYFGLDTLTYAVCDDGTPLPERCDTAQVIIRVTDVFFDLALDKMLAPGQSFVVDLGDDIHYLIKVTNEGLEPAYNYTVTDHIPDGLVLSPNDLNWTSIALDSAIYTFAGPLNAGESDSVEIILRVQYGASGATLTNVAEVLTVEDEDGNVYLDIDSEPNNGVPGEDDIDEQPIELIPHDPTGWIYCDKTGRVVTGGTISVTGPNGIPNDQVVIVENGSSGYYEFFTNGTPGIYTITYNHPNGYPMSISCLPMPGAYDPTGQPDPVVFGSDVSGGYMLDTACASNPYYLQFELEPGDPYIELNNIPVRCVFIGSLVCEDVDQNDIHDGTEPGYEGMIVNLYDCADTLNAIKTTVTDSLGRYRFDGLTDGDYRVQFVIPAGYRPIQGSPVSDDGFADCVTLNFGECDTTTSICLILCPLVNGGSDVDICYGSSTQLIANASYGSGTYTWTPPAGLSNPNIFNPVASPLVTTQYVVTYDDGLGCVDTDTVTVRVRNTTPYLVSGPADVTLECNVDPIPFLAPVFADSCDANLTVTMDSLVTQSSCGYTIERTWTATNDQGNSMTYTQTVAVEDTTTPTITVVHPIFGPILDGDTLYADCTQIPSFNFNMIDVYEACCLRPVDFQETVVRGNCEEDGYERIMYCGWTAEDCCGNRDSLFFTVIVRDNNPPTLNGVPANTTVSCDNIPPVPVVTATDNCDDAVVVDFDENIVSDNNDCVQRIERTWTATDSCGNTATATQLITVQDVEAPVITIINPLFSNIEDGDTLYLECNQVPSFNETDVNTSDTCCDDVTVEFQEFITAGDCREDGFLQHMYCGWIAEDCCGNRDSLFFTVFVLDNTPPVLHNIPGNMNLACDGPTTPLPVVTATDNCDNTVTVTLDADTTYNACGYVILRTWTATDDCGNVATGTQTVTVTDGVAPNIFNVPANTTAECGQIPPVPNNVTVSDNCDATPTLTFSETSSGVSCPFTITRTWTATDDCGNTRIRTQTILVNDNTPPVLAGLPADMTIECGTTPPPPPVVTATDACWGSVPVTYIQLINTTDPCRIVYNRIWSAEDNCGNQVAHHQHIQVVDNEAPVITVTDTELVGVSSGDTLTVDCNAVPTLEENEAFATDNCDNSPFIYRFETIEKGNCETDDYLLFMRCGWRAYDDCGNQSEWIVYFKVVDNTPPVILGGVPADITIDCDNTLPPVTANIIANDNCDDTLDVSVKDVIITGNCNGNYTVARTWTVTDDCGNAATATQRIHVRDTKAPLLYNIPVNATVECGQVPSVPTNVTASDNCDATPTLTFNEVIGTGCPYTITRTWTATDDCGNVTTATQTITVNDTQKPVLAGVPANMTLECSSNVPAPAAVTATDNCDTNVAVTLSETTTGSGCNYTLTRTWTATDDCGNVTTATQIITVNDTQKPVLAGVPANMTLECSSNVPAPAAVTATDNCDTNVAVTLSETTTGSGCNYTLTRTWTATDDCGNSSTATQVITVRDNLAPVIAEPADLTVNCSQLPAPVTPDVTDNCDDDPDIDFYELAGNYDDCTYQIKRIWTATDDCGNQSVVEQTITVIDDSTPTLVFIHPLLAGLTDGDTLTMECSNASIFGAKDAIAQDACGEATVTFVEGPFTVGNCEEDGFVVRMACYWIASDDCGHADTTTLYMNIIDTKPPVFTQVPANVTVNCNVIIPTFGQVTIKDDCSDDVNLTFVDNTVLQGNCTTIITRTWTATDDCGNTATATQSVTVTDNFPPVLADVPVNVTIECGQTIPAAPNVTATDNCDQTPTVSLTQNTVNSNNCSYQLVRTWTATDDCGNTATATQTITVIDNTKPVLAGVPSNVTIECGQTIPAAPNVTATDNCDQTPTVSLTQNTVNSNNCGYQLVRTWTATDECGNTATASQTITVTDTTDPVLAGIPANQSLDCDQAIPAAPVVTATDNCDTSPAVTLAESTVNLNCGYRLIRTWTATDDCGNTATATQTIIVTDTTDPVLAGVPADVTVNLAQGQNIPAVAVVTATDNCDNSVTPSFSETIQGSGCNYTLTRTWTATDDCGNSTADSQIITVLNSIQVSVTSTPDTCSQGDGTAILSPSTYSYAWSDGGTGFSRTGLDAGTYTVTATQGNCTQVVEVTVGAVCFCNPAIVSSVDRTIATCGQSNGSATIQLTGNEADYSYFWLPNHGTPNAAGNSRTGLPAGHYVVLMTYQGNVDCVEKVEFDIEDDCPPCAPIFEFETLTDELSSDPGQVCLPVPFSVSQVHDIYVDGIEYNLPLVQCDAQTVIFYSYAIAVGAGQSGPYQVSWEYNNTTLNTIVNDMDELVAAMNAVDPAGNWYHNPAAFGFASSNTGGNYGDMTITHIATQISAFIQTNFSSTPMGTQLTLPVDASEIVYVNPQTGCSDTLLLNLTLASPKPEIFEEPLVVTSISCDYEPSGHCLKIPYTELYQYRFTLNGQPFTGNFSVCNYVANHFYTYVSLPGLGNNGSYRLDSWRENGEVHTASFQNIAELVALMNQWDPAGNWTLDAASMIISGGSSMGTYTNMRITVLNTGAIGILELNTNYTPGMAFIELPDGENTLIATRLSDGYQDTMQVRIACITPDYYNDIIGVGTVDTVCLNLDELLGDVASIHKVCEEGAGAPAILRMMPGSNCVEYIGDHVGISSGCYVICDEYGICDTTYMEITVRTEEPSSLKPDTLYTELNQPVTGNVLVNDQVDGAIVRVSVVVEPEHGTATVNPDGTVTYTPDEGYCNEGGILDYFTYEVCTATGCQMTGVYIHVGCGDLVIYTGFSPNGDGVNDFFRIEGLSKYPKHELTIFNRWGNRVFHSKDYKNDWDGTWSDKQLPDGTYFYLFDDGEGKTHSGYLQIRR
jgi:gliding motility-associated-like protein/uncharacterized repeat protein (TIGR01451 family)